jgi:sulfatase maturation enzyme AslB (radical SAM superfamily)
VYWGRSGVALTDLAGLGAAGVLASPEFARTRLIPDACRRCPFVATCQGGCAGRRELAGDLAMPDPYCPLVRGERMDLEWTRAEGQDLLKTGSACTTVFAPA